MGIARWHEMSDRSLSEMSDRFSDCSLTTACAVSNCSLTTEDGASLHCA